jgi:hypothetical protein
VCKAAVASIYKAAAAAKARANRYETAGLNCYFAALQAQAEAAELAQVDKQAADILTYDASLYISISNADLAAMSAWANTAAADRALAVEIRNQLPTWLNRLASYGANVSLCRVGEVLGVGGVIIAEGSTFLLGGVRFTFEVSAILQVGNDAVSQMFINGMIGGGAGAVLGSIGVGLGCG